MKGISDLVTYIEDLGWNIDIDGSEITLSKESPANQDFNLTVTANNLEELIEAIKERHENFDCSEETYLWLDKTGHGKRGAPYDMKDLYEDMAACAEMMGELYESLEELLETEEKS